MLKVNSKKIEPGDTFIAIKSAVRDGHDYIEDAIDRGAACIIAEKGEYSVKTIIVGDTRTYLAKYLKELYEDKISKLKLIGITGTNGKTTSAYFIYQLLNKLDIKTAYIGTIGFYLPEKNRPLVNTTPDLYDLYDMLVEAADEECQYVVMEVSSQALVSRRLEGLTFDIAAFTNLTEDHLDYHGTMKAYREAKLNLFYKIKRNGYTIINGDDPSSKHFILKENKNIIFGKNKDYQIDNIELAVDKSHFTITKDESISVTLPVPGIYNIYNYIYAYIICDQMNIDAETVLEKTLELKAPLGRYQVVKNDQKTVIIDYAHTPDAVFKIIESVKEVAKGKVNVLIGCGGDRDLVKRPIIGTIVTDSCDHVYFTSDNPRTEDPEAILNDITQYLTNSNYEVILHREDAIKKAVNDLEENDILLVLGKGHENYQIIGTDKFHFSDLEEVNKYIK